MIAQRMGPARRLILIATFAMAGLAAACTGSGPATQDAAPPDSLSDSDSDSGLPEAGQEATQPPAVAATTVAGSPASLLSPFDIVSRLASDEYLGRNNQTIESELVQAFLVEQLRQFATTVERVEFDAGVNLIATIPGGDLADEVVMVGAHYDHLGAAECLGTSEIDTVCNGATDNAAGVAAALHVGRALAAAEPRRTVIVALWDGEEDGLQGSRAYVGDPVVPLERIVTYLNFDIQGAQLSPSLANHTLLIGAESGGDVLATAARAAGDASPLEYVSFSLVFGQGRSDHTPFAASGVPVVFFADATNGCYHTVDDDLDALDLAKLEHQIAAATQLGLELIDVDPAPTFDTTAPVTVFADALSLQQLVRALEPDFVRLGPGGEDTARTLLGELDVIAQAGAGAYDGAAATTVLTGAAYLVDALAGAPCEAVR